MNKLILFALFVFALIIMSYRGTQKRKRIVFFGDSITELGVKPNGYIAKIQQTLAAEQNDKYELIGSGISGHKIYDLYLRAEQDVLAKQPDIVVIYIGVNDVWHKRLIGTGTDFDRFGKFYNALIERLNKAGIKTVVCTPAVIGERTDHSNEQDGDLNKYSNWIREFAAKNNLPIVDLRKLFLEYNLANNKENKESGILTTDRVHLNEKGNEFVANEMWKVLKNL